MIAPTIFHCSNRQEGHEVAVLELADRFGVREMASDASKDQRFLASLLYYFGILTLNGETDEGELRLTIPTKCRAPRWSPIKT